MAAFRVFLIALALTAPVWALSAVPAHACSCGRDRLSLEESLEIADVVAVGVVSDARPSPGEPSLSPNTYGSMQIDVEIEIEEYLRGSGSRPMVLHTRGSVFVDADGEVSVEPGGNPSCGYVPELQSRLLLYFETEDEDLVLNSCLTNTNANEVRIEEAIEYLKSEREAENSSIWPLALAASGLLILLSGAAIFLSRRRAS